MDTRASHTGGHHLLMPVSTDQKMKNTLLLAKGELRLKVQKDENPFRFLLAGASSLSLSSFPSLSCLPSLSLLFFSSFSLPSLFSLPSHPFSFCSTGLLGTLQKLLSRAGLLSLALKLPPEPTGYSFRCLTSVEHN